MFHYISKKEKFQGGNYMNKMKYLKLLNPVFMFLVLLIPSVTGSLFHWSLLAAAILIVFINGLVVHKLSGDFENLYRFSYFDSLTKIPNRLSTDLYCRQLSSVENLSVAVVDLDNLKVTNDTHGHLAGDELLRTFASIFFDCGNPDGFTARNGGDEFIVLFNNESSSQMLEEFCIHLQERIDSSNEHSSLYISYSIGCAFGQNSTCKTVYELVSLADQMMYQQKKAKKAALKKQKGCTNDKEESQ